MESKIQKEILTYLEKEGCYVVKVVIANKSGVPDILFCKDGKFFAIEVKDKGKKKNTTRLQEMNLEKIRSVGGSAIIADSVDDVMLLMKQYTKESIYAV